MATPQKFAPISQNEIDSFHQLLAQSHPVTPAPKAKGNFLTHLLPTLGGTGGAIAGAAAGTAVAPGIGTLLGALLGGAAGGGASKVGENAIEHNKLSSGVVGQAVEQGVLGAGPIRLAKAATFGVKAGVDAAKAGQGLEGAIVAAGDRTAKPALGKTAQNLVTQGQAAQGRVAGTSAGKVAGEFQSPQDNARMLQTLKSEKISIGNANNTYRDLQSKLDSYGKGISDHFTANNTPLSKPEVNGLAKEYVGSLKTSDPRVIKEANIIAQDLKKNVSDTQGLWEFRKSLDSRIPDKKLAAGDNVLSNQMKAVKVGRQFLAEKLGKAPGLDKYHALSDIKPFVAGEAQRANNLSGGVVQKIAGSGPIQKAEAQLGKLTEKTGNALGGSSATDITRGLTPGRIAARTLPIGAAQAAGSNMADQVPTQPQQPDASQQPSSDLLSALQAAQDQSTQSATPYSQENLMADIQRDPKHASEYLSTYSSLDKIFNPPANSKNQIKPTGQQFGLAQGGMNSLNQLAQLLQGDPSLTAKNQTPGQGLPLVGNLITNAAGAGDYHALADNVLSSLIHLQTGATATPEEVKAAKGQLPGPGDSPEAVQRKLANLQSMFQPYVQGGTIGNQSSNSGSDLLSALMASGYGG